MDIKNIDHFIEKTNDFINEGILYIQTIQEVHFKVLEIAGVKLKVFKDGVIYRWRETKRPHWKLVQNVVNDLKGYNNVNIVGNMIKRHRIIAYAFKGLDINDSKKEIDHIDGKRLNNNSDNLRIVSSQQNNFNRTTSKGYSWHKQSQKWKAKITLNGKDIHLGLFKNEDDARKAYLDAKKIYHKIE